MVQPDQQCASHATASAAASLPWHPMAQNINHYSNDGTTEICITDLTGTSLSTGVKV